MKPSSNSAPNLRVTEALKDRALAFADRLFKSLQRLGCDIQWRGNIDVQTPQGSVRLSIQEEVISVEREPTAEERKRIWWGDHKLQTERTSGRLLVQIESYLYNVSEERSWLDEKKRPVERRIDEIASSVVTYAKAMAEELERQAIQKRQRRKNGIHAAEKRKHDNWRSAESIA